jgi:hypothetical protein
MKFIAGRERGWNCRKLAWIDEYGNIHPESLIR